VLLLVQQQNTNGCETRIVNKWVSTARISFPAPHLSCACVCVGGGVQDIKKSVKALCCRLLQLSGWRVTWFQFQLCWCGCS